MFANEAVEGWEAGTVASRCAAQEAAKQAAEFSQLAHKLMRAVYSNKAKCAPSSGQPGPRPAPARPLICPQATPTSRVPAHSCQTQALDPSGLQRT